MTPDLEKAIDEEIRKTRMYARIAWAAAAVSAIAAGVSTANFFGTI